jgi:hypothetical protein
VGLKQKIIELFVDEEERKGGRERERERKEVGKMRI